MNIHILYVGNIKDKYLAEAVAEYEKRLGAYVKITNTELKEAHTPENPSEAQIAAAIKDEGERLIAALPPKSYKIALAVEGKELSSEEFAARLDKIAVDGNSKICFIIGGSYGMAEEVKKLCDMRLSVSKMTFTHRMMRFILLEQIYRAYNILSGGKYHK